MKDPEPNSSPKDVSSVLRKPQPQPPPPPRESRQTKLLKPLGALRKSCADPIVRSAAAVPKGKSFAPSYVRRTHGRHDRAGKKRGEFVLDCCNALWSRIPQYSDLRDNYLRYFFDRPSRKCQLDKSAPMQGGSRSRLAVRKSSNRNRVS